MFRRLSVLAALGAAVALSLPAMADDEMRPMGVYLSIAGGGNFTEDSDIDGVDPLDVTVETDPGFAVLGALGYAHGNGVRTELELGYRMMDIDALDFGSLGSVSTSDSDISAFSVMLNGVYDFMTGRRWTPYLGVGVGAAFVNVEASAPGLLLVDDEDTQFAYQGIAGIGYNVNRRLQVFVDYRYFGTTDLSLRTVGDVGINADFRNHTVMAGLRFTFVPPPPPPPEPEVVEAPPPPPPPPPEPQMPMNYLVFFDWDRSDLTEEGMRVVAAAAQNALSGGISTIMATGHADLSGPDPYNMGLSQQRAETVRDQLILLGVPAEMISIAWKGEREPLVPTPDGVREPQNRRVEILFE